MNPVESYCPPCTKCGALTTLARVTPVPHADHDSRVFQCTACGKIDMLLVQFK